MIKATKRWICTSCEGAIPAGTEFTILFGDLLCPDCASARGVGPRPKPLKKIIKLTRRNLHT
jgi:hypothetical protein